MLVLYVFVCFSCSFIHWLKVGCMAALLGVENYLCFFPQEHVPNFQNIRKYVRKSEGDYLSQWIEIFEMGCGKVLKAGEMLEALRSDFGLAATDTPTVWSTGTDTAGTAGTLLPGQQEGWTLKLLGLQGETKVLRNLPCQITFGNLHEKIREVTGAKDQGCDVKLMLNGTVLQHSRATVLSDMSRCNGMELTYLMQPLGFASNGCRSFSHWFIHWKYQKGGI